MTQREPSAATRPRRADTARNVQSLLTAAKTLFDEQGPDVALDEVARRAGVGNATLYRTWLDSFVVHVATKRALALTGTENNSERRTELFDQWHKSMRSTAQKLLARAQQAGTVDAGLTVDDLLALTSAAAIAATGTEHARQLLRTMRHGFAGRPARLDY